MSFGLGNVAKWAQKGLEYVPLSTDFSPLSRGIIAKLSLRSRHREPLSGIGELLLMLATLSRLTTVQRNLTSRI